MMHIVVGLFWIVVFLGIALVLLPLSAMLALCIGIFLFAWLIGWAALRIVRMNKSED